MNYKEFIYEKILLSVSISKNVNIIVNIVPPPIASAICLVDDIIEFSSFLRYNYGGISPRNIISF